MSYNKNIWKRKDRITKEKLNHMEEGIYDAHDKIEGTINDFSSQIKDIKNIQCINILDYKELIKDNDYTAVLKYAIEKSKNGDTIVFPNLATIILSDTIIIDKGIVIDFRGSSIIANVNNKDVFDLRFTGEKNDRINLINFNFVKNSICPENIIKINGSINSYIKGNFHNVKANNSIIHNYKGYGTRIKSELRDCISPSGIYLSSSSSEIHSFDIKIDCDITRQSGFGIQMEGGTIKIEGVVESCLGGIYYNGIHNLNACSIQVHCEQNREFDIKLGKETIDSTGATGVGEVNIMSSLFGVNSSLADFKSIIYGSNINLTIMNCTGVKGYIMGATSKCSLINLIGRGSCESDFNRDIFVNQINYNSANFNDISATNIEIITGGKIKTDKMHIKNIVSDGNLGLYTGSGSYIMGETSLLPSANKQVDIGGEWNMFNNVFCVYLNMTSPNGTRYRVYMNDSGDLVKERISN